MEAFGVAVWGPDRVAERAEAECERTAERAADADYEETLQMARDDCWMRELIWQYHQRGAERERAEEARRHSVPSIAVGEIPPGYGQAWPEIAR